LTTFLIFLAVGTAAGFGVVRVGAEGRAALARRRDAGVARFLAGAAFRAAAAAFRAGDFFFLAEARRVAEARAGRPAEVLRDAGRRLRDAFPPRVRAAAVLAEAFEALDLVELAARFRPAADRRTARFLFALAMTLLARRPQAAPNRGPFPGGV
jgi:hypothetical protein